VGVVGALFSAGAEAKNAVRRVEKYTKGGRKKQYEGVPKENPAVGIDGGTHSP
jgi:hypothetical protein